MDGKPVARKLETREDVQTAVNIVASAFSQNPFTICLAREYAAEHATGQALTDDERREIYIASMFTTALDAEHLALEVGGWSAVVLWRLPVYPTTVDSDELTLASGSAAPQQSAPDQQPVPLSRTGSIKAELTVKREQLLEKYISKSGDVVNQQPSGRRLRPYYYLSFLARNPDIPPVRGAITAAVQPMLDRAKEEHIPVWLLATDVRAVALYKYYGFRLCETITIGEGKVNGKGDFESGGAGMKGYGMILEPSDVV